MWGAWVLRKKSFQILNYTTKLKKHNQECVSLGEKKYTAQWKNEKIQI